MLILVLIVALAIIVAFIYLYFFQWSVSIPDYMAARHYRYGRPSTESPISGRRITVIPGIDHLVMIDKRIQKSTLENISVLTKERQMMKFAITLIWKTVDAAKTIESIRPEDIEPTFFKIAESVIKNEASKMNVDEILENRNLLSKNLLSILSESTESWGIAVSSVNIASLSVVNEAFMRNMALPKEIELERKAKLAELDKDLAIELRGIEKDRDSELFKLESEQTIGTTREEIATILERAKKNRELTVQELQTKLEQGAAAISLIQQNCLAAAEAERIKTVLLAETEGLRAKLQVTNAFSPSAMSYEMLRILPDLYKNIKMGDVTLFNSSNDSGSHQGGFDFYNYTALSALAFLKTVGGCASEPGSTGAASTVEATEITDEN